jgi:ATP phosphoribosyltransferase regulatory subunit
MQAGLECICDIDEYQVFEVLYLAGLSLKAVSEDFTLSVSDVKIVNDILDIANLSSVSKREVLIALSSKNENSIKEVFARENASQKCLDAILSLCSIYGDYNKAKTVLENLDFGEEFNSYVSNFLTLVSSLCDTELKDRVKVDFSVISDGKYYNGTIFSGFISGISTAVLSGGRYDVLMKRMGKSSGAIGFAVYLDQIIGLGSKNSNTVDVLLIYEKGDNLLKVKEQVFALTSQGLKVFATTNKDCGIKYRELKELKNL